MVATLSGAILPLNVEPLPSRVLAHAAFVPVAPLLIASVAHVARVGDQIVFVEPRDRIVIEKDAPADLGFIARTLRLDDEAYPSPSSTMGVGRSP